MNETGNVKERLINSAIELISARSYSTVGVQELCVRVGVTKGSFYHYFPSKRDLTLASIDAIWEIYWNKFLEPVLNSDVSTREKFDRLIEVFYNYYSSEKETGGFMNGCKLGNLALELSTQDEAIRQRLERVFLGWITYLERTLEHAVEIGELPQDTDIQTSARSVIAYLEGLALLGKTFNDPGFIKRLSRGAYRLIIGKENK